MSSSNYRKVDDYLVDYDHDFTIDISKKMQVPKKIKVAEDDAGYQNFDHIETNSTGSETFMRVPERIIVAGSDHHIAGKSHPRELQLDQAVIPPDPEFIRVQTPPRVLTLSEHNFPTADDDKYQESTINHNSKPTILQSRLSNFELYENEVAVSEELNTMKTEIMKLSRKMMIMELENQQIRNREFVLYSLGFAYLVLKSLAWLFRN